MRLKASKFHDYWRGDGVFVSVIHQKGWHLLAVRPKRWRVDCVEPPAKPGVKRWYFGPFEYERARVSPIVKPIL